ncbi:uncharacterized protein ARMOST_21494 [Armillaria ostoyae]|uniref:Uncharacterized protein n=1 Tax=Armillaria ostoyae TaxID=47428 RepID=A0A284SA88_ARMOS|nr:uncharacterized protein ARMOST_21494 [Armillaria ostoyae]
MTHIAIRKLHVFQCLSNVRFLLRPELEVWKANACISVSPYGESRLTGTKSEGCIVDMCGYAGCRDVLRLMSTLEVPNCVSPLYSIEEPILDIPPPQGMI